MPIVNIHLRSAHGKYLCAEADHTMVANRDAPGPWETFSLVHRGGNKYALKTAHGM